MQETAFSLRLRLPDSPASPLHAANLLCPEPDGLWLGKPGRGLGWGGGGGAVPKLPSMLSSVRTKRRVLGAVLSSSLRLFFALVKVLACLVVRGWGEETQRVPLALAAVISTRLSVEARKPRQDVWFEFKQIRAGFEGLRLGLWVSTSACLTCLICRRRHSLSGQDG